MTASAAPLKQTPLHTVHRGMGAKMVDFEGWDMPVEYSDIIPEHRAVRQAAGLFDVSHMGEIVISGPQALDPTQHVITNDASKLKIGQAQYSSMLYAHGGFVDDILVHRLAGWVTSGGPAPALNKNIGMCYLPFGDAGPGRSIEVMVRGRAVEAVTIPLPFYKRAR